MLLAKVKTERIDIMDQIQQLQISLESNPSYSNTMIAVSRGMSERNSAVGLEYEISNFDWSKDILYKTFQNKIVFIKNNPWVKIMSTNILDKNITTSAKELPQSFGDMTYITLRNPKRNILSKSMNTEIQMIIMIKSNYAKDIKISHYWI